MTFKIKHSNLSSIALRLLSYGITDILNFNFMEKPPIELISKAISDLKNLGAIGQSINLFFFYLNFEDYQSNLTTMGRKIAKFPVDPQIAIMLLQSATLGCVKEAITLAAMLSAPPCFYWPKKKRAQQRALEAKKRLVHFEGDHFTLLNVFQQFVTSTVMVLFSYCLYCRWRKLPSMVLRELSEFPFLGICMFHPKTVDSTDASTQL